MRKKIAHTFSSLKIRNYRLYFIGQAISLSGTWMQTIGQSWLVLKLTNSGTQLGLVTAAQFLPILLFGPWGGVIADRFNKRRLLYFTQASAAILALILGILMLSGLVKLWMIYLLALGLGLINTVDNPVRQTFITEMVGKDNLPNAVSLNSAQVNLARVIGPALGGVLIAALGLTPLFFINAVSYVAVLIALYKMHEGELHPAPRTGNAKGQLKKGFKYIWATPVLRNTLLMMALVGTLSYEFTVVLPLFAQFTFHGSAGSYAALTAAMGAGSVVGGIYTATRKKTTPAMFVRASLLFGLVILLTAIMPNLILAMAGLALVGAFSINFLSLGNVTLQLESAPEMRGRVMSLWAVAFLGSTPIGGPIIGWISQHSGPRWGLAVGGAAAILASVLGSRKLPGGPISAGIKNEAEQAITAETRTQK